MSNLYGGYDKDGNLKWFNDQSLADGYTKEEPKTVKPVEEVKKVAKKTSKKAS